MDNDKKAKTQDNRQDKSPDNTQNKNPPQHINIIEEYQRKWGKMLEETDREIANIYGEFVPVAWDWMYY